MDTVSPYPRCAAATAFFGRLMNEFADANPAVATLIERFEGVGVDVLALVDHWTLPPAPDLVDDLTEWGFVEEAEEDGTTAWHQPLARLPRVRLLADALAGGQPTLGVEEVGLFLQQTGWTASERAGDFDSAYETALVPLASGAAIQIVARRGYRGFTPGTLTQADRDALARARASFVQRLRSDDEAAVVADALARYAEAASEIGGGRAVDEFFAAERDYYLGRNAAARFQYGRQQEVGIGWANHDHHTYRSSREGFQGLLRLWQAMGFVFRERYYAGDDAGWGAQILEHPISRVVMFCDVDMSPEEIDINFLKTSLPARSTYGTIGLWCALHGSSVAASGMHHIECEFDYAKCEEGYRAAGFGVMKPFTDLPILKQAFTAPELWKVVPKKLTELQNRGAITAEQAEKFATVGAAGSHVEILQRWEGFKGFNKTGVSKIIKETDARRAVVAAGHIK